MSEDVGECLQPLSFTRRHPVSQKPVPCRTFIIKLRRTPQPAPDAAAGAFLQQDIVAVHQQQESGMSFRHGLLWAWRGQLLDAAGIKCDATGLRRALAASRLA